jgi:peroxiredoxin
MTIAIGDRAPDFSLPFEPSPELVTLSSFRGEKNVVLLFIPFAFSSVCTDEFCQVVEDYSKWTELDAEILGITVDSPFITRKFAEEIGAGFPVLSDFNKEVMSAYGAMYDDYFGMRGVAKRSAFVVDKAGAIRYAWVSEDDSVLPDFEAIREVLRGLD